uniref:contractile injection system sheath initiator n=1 Tax=Clostridium sp. NkU-1 TaxID=1095009 RepID=UPI0006D2AFC1
MATLPESASTDIYENESREYPTETYLVDKSTGTIKRVGGGLEAMKQAAEIILDTERYQNQIYTSNFGRELKKLIGKLRNTWPVC